MALLKRLDAFDVTYADSFTRKELKVNEVRARSDGRMAAKGVGEKRIYVGRDEKELDKFFEFALSLDPKGRIPNYSIKGFFIQKDDLEEYANAIESEYVNPSYPYGDGVDQTLEILDRYRDKLKGLEEQRLYIKFEKKFDAQNRYYLVIPKGDKESAYNYSFIHDVCLPRVTRLLLIKMYDKESASKDRFIYIKPFYGEKQTGSIKSAVSIKTKPLDDEGSPSRYRKDQDKYRAAVLQRYPYCVVTKATDPNLLAACHIKDYAKCQQAEKYDGYNGLTMTPTIHALFDSGYLTFDMDGRMILSGFFRENDRRCLGLNKTIRIHLSEQSKPYLKWHNEHVFIRTSRGLTLFD